MSGSSFPQQKGKKYVTVSMQLLDSLCYNAKLQIALIEIDCLVRRRPIALISESVLSKSLNLINHVKLCIDALNTVQQAAYTITSF
jgi:hypothetical protein